MKIICAGMSKTGTKSLAAALRSVGYNVYDVEEQLSEFADEWYELVQHGKIPDFKSMFKNVDAVTDAPACFYFAEILEAFPESKVILMTREEEAWAKSMAVELEEVEKVWTGMNRVFSYMSPSFAKIKVVAIAVSNAAVGTCNPKATQIYRHHFHMHNNRVKEVVSKDQLLIYSVKEGWAPLCEFLAIEVPKKPFPHLNKGASYTRDYRVNGKSEAEARVLRETAIRLAILFALLAAILYACFA